MTAVNTISDLRAKAAHFRRVAELLDETIKVLVEGGEPGEPNKQSVAHSETVRHDLKNLSGVDAVERVLDESDTPLNKEAILQFLSARGKAIGGTTLQSYLSREKKRFASLGRGQWTTVRKKILAEI